MSWQPCPRCGDGNSWRAVWCEGCGTRLGLEEVMPNGREHGSTSPATHVNAVRAPDLPTPPKAVRLARSNGTERAYPVEAETQA